MAHPIVMPSFGMYTAEGTLVEWRQPDGAPVTIGQTIAEIETDKAVQELPCPATGVLHHVARVGTLLTVEGLLGYVLAAGEAAPHGQPDTAIPAGATAVPGRDEPRPAPDRRPNKASPIARRLAAEHGIALSSLTGSGPAGRIVEADIVAALARHSSAPSPAPAVRQRTAFTPMRRAIGDRLRHSLNSAIALTLTREVEADRLVAARRHAVTGGAPAIPFDAYFVKLLAAALVEHPELNSSVEGHELIQWAEINVGVAVSLPAGLVVPVIHGANHMPLAEIGRQIREVATRARASALRSEELAGGTCTITNLGAVGIDAFTPVLNPPQACVLGIGRILPRAVARDAGLGVANTCVLSLTFDHRVTDGAPAAHVLETIATLMNDEPWLTRLHEDP